ncbi:MAG: helix-turn-helix domain-containing protein [Candidatus Faecivicinus sp.]|nr:helix-turn-helix domain-containing protein [Candidatus Faecivicinus sp.]
MYLDHRVTTKIARVLNMIDVNALLLDNTGAIILPEGDSRTLNLPEAIRQNPTMPLVYGGVTLIGTNEEQPVFICLHGDSEDVKKCAVLCAELINMMLREDMTHTNSEQSLRLMLRGDVETSEFESLAAEHGIPMQANRCVIYFYFQDMEAETAIKLMADSLDSEDDRLAEVGRHSVAMLKTISEDETFEELEEYARAIESTFLTETGHGVFIGISEPREDLISIPEAFEEARSAINVGRIYHTNRTVFVYRNLLLERFLNEVTPEMSAGYNSKIFNRKTARLFNEEMIHTIETFFDNSLNLSETARKLYIHRNTLVYRLEKVQRTIGLDLRNFDDAVTFKMMMLLGKNTGNRKFRL